MTTRTIQQLEGKLALSLYRADGTFVSRRNLPAGLAIRYARNAEAAGFRVGVDLAWADLPDTFRADGTRNGSPR